MVRLFQAWQVCKIHRVWKPAVVYNSLKCKIANILHRENAGIISWIEANSLIFHLWMNENWKVLTCLKVILTSVWWMYNRAVALDWRLRAPTPGEVSGSQKQEPHRHSPSKTYNEDISNCPRSCVLAWAKKKNWLWFSSFAGQFQSGLSPKKFQIYRPINATGQTI